MTENANVSSRLSGSPLIAPAWHTIVFIAIFVGMSVAGGFFQHAVKQHPQATVPSGNAVPRYISVLVFEWLLVLYVRMGVHKRGMRLRDLVGGRWTTPKEVMKDIALGAGPWAVWIGLMNVMSWVKEQMPRRDFFREGFLKASCGYRLLSQQGFVRRSHFAAIFRSNFGRSRVMLDGQSFSRRLYSALAIYTKAWVQ